MPNGRPANVRSHRRGGDRRRPSPWLVRAVVAVLVCGGLTAGWTSPRPPQPAPARTTRRRGRVAGHRADPRSAQQGPGRRPNRRSPARACRCGRGEGLRADGDRARRRRWDATATGPAPDVWVPASSVWIRQARRRQRTAEHLHAGPAAEPGPFAHRDRDAPDMATALGWPDKIEVRLAGPRRPTPRNAELLDDRRGNQTGVTSSSR